MSLPTHAYCVALGCALSGLVMACSEDVATGRRCPATDSGCAGRPRPIHGASGAGGTASSQAGTAGDVVRTDDALRVHVADIAGMTIEIVTLACAGDCADVEAVAAGGNPPYVFAWEDGSTDPKRHVCLDASATLTVSASDTAIVNDEFGYDAQRVSAQVSANVLQCADAGTPDDGVCIENPSFEGTPQLNVFEDFDAVPWLACPGGTPDIADATLISGLGEPVPVPSDGASCLRMARATDLGAIEIASQPLCMRLKAGTDYALRIDLVAPPGDNYQTLTPPALELWGGDNACEQRELLWTSAAPGTTWHTQCAAFTPERDAGFITLVPHVDAGTGMLYVDHIVPVPACP